MLEACFIQTGEALEAVGINRSAWLHVSCQKPNQGGALEIWNNLHPSTPGRSSSAFDSDQHQRRLPILELAAAAQASLASTHPGIIDLNLSPQWFPRRVHHRAPKFMKHHPGGLITVQPELALKEQGRHSPLVRRHQVSRPEPDRQRSFRVVQDRPSRQGRLVAAPGALPSV
jgi:hypothetical protein